MREVQAVPAKTRKIAPAQDVPKIFSDDRVRQLAAEAKLPSNADLPRFAAAIRDAAAIYIRDVSTSDDNAVHHEIKALYGAAARRRYADAAERIANLSKRTRDFISKRGERPSVPWKLPDADTLRNEATRDDACAAIVSLLRIGGRRQEGRRRPGGKRSMTFTATLHAPKLQKHPQKRQAERNFVMSLQLAYTEATGQLPSLTVNPERPGPFAKMAKVCLKSIGMPAAGVIELISELDCRARLKGRVNNHLGLVFCHGDEDVDGQLVRACGLSAATNSTPDSIRLETK
jgi:hypothetical protein